MIYIAQNKQTMMRSSLFIAILLIAGACNKVPLTGRSQTAWIPSSQMSSLSETSYNDVLQTSQLANGTTAGKQVQRVGKKIQAAVEKYMRENGLAEELKDFAWEFNLIKDNTVNAWCMPGGKVAFYTGIMPICKDDAGVAVVMGHEIAHAIAKHGNERMTHSLMQSAGSVALAVALRDKPQETQAMFMTAYGVGSQIGVMLPFSRTHETEADKLGLIFMAMAGYNPHEAPAFWTRMAAQSQGAPPEFLSTHPSHDTRIKNLNEFMPEAMKYYQ